MNLSVVILNYNVRHFLELCLKSVIAAIANLDAEIIVVDNSSDDDSTDMVKQMFPEVKLIENPENYGFSKGNNMGVAHAQGKYVCILNPDTVVPEDCFVELLNFAEDKTDLGILGCQLLDGRGSFLPESKRNVPYPHVAIKKVLGMDSSYYAQHLQPNEVDTVDILVGAFMLLKTEVYNELCGFDESYFMYGEDIDLSYKALKKGYKNYYYGKVRVIHFKGESTIKNKVYAKRFYGAMSVFYKRHFKKSLFLNALVSCGTRIAAALSQKPQELPIFIERTHVFTKSKHKNSFKTCPLPLTIQSELKKPLEGKTMVVYDLDSFTHKQVIEDMHIKGQQNELYFRIIPRNSTFMIGSDSALTPGREIKLNQSLDE